MFGFFSLELTLLISHSQCVVLLTNYDVYRNDVVKTWKKYHMICYGSVSVDFNELFSCKMEVKQCFDLDTNHELSRFGEFRIK